MEKKSDRVLKYLTKELSYIEQQEFLIDLENDASLKEEYDFQNELRNYILGKTDHDEVFEEADIEKLAEELRANTYSDDSDSNEDLKDFIKESLLKANESLKQPTVKKTASRGLLIKKFIPWISAAAALVILLIVFNSTTGSITGEQLYNKFHTSFDPLSYNFRGTEKAEIEFRKGLKLYLEKDFEEAHRTFSSIGNETKYLDEAIYYNSLCLMEMGLLNEAITSFNSYLNFYTTYAGEARWYLALCYTRSGMYQEAEVLLQEITRQNTIYQRSARRLLKRLDRIK